MSDDLAAVTFFQIFSIGMLSGTSAYLLMPLIAADVISFFLASLLGVIITIPIMLYFLDVPQTPFDFHKYYDQRRFSGITLDFIMTLLSAFAPGVIFLYGLVRMSLMPPFPVAFSAAVGVFTGYSAFLYRNRVFFENNKLDIKF